MAVGGLPNYLGRSAKRRDETYRNSPVLLFHQRLLLLLIISFILLTNSREPHPVDARSELELLLGDDQVVNDDEKLRYGPRFENFERLEGSVTFGIVVYGEIRQSWENPSPIKGNWLILSC